MYELIDKGNGNWVLVIGQKATFMGSFKSVIRTCLRELKFNPAELDMAVSEMCKHETHDTLHFGVYKKFLFSYDSKKQQKVG